VEEVLAMTGEAWRGDKVTAVMQASGFHRRNSLSKDGTFYLTCHRMDRKGEKWLQIRMVVGKKV